MKAFSLTFLTLTIITSLAASPRCARLDLYDIRDLRASIEKDLISNVWKSAILGAESTMYFKDDGLVITVATSGHLMHTYLWSVTLQDNLAVLTVSDPGSRAEFIVAPTCNGISAQREGKLHSLQLSEDVQITPEQHAFLRSQLPGRWHYRSNATRKAYPAGFTISLIKDGSFKMMSAPDTYHSAVHGIWHLSPDGKFLILYTEVNTEDSRKFVPEVIRLKSVDFEDMVIGGENLPRALQPYDGQREIFLSKARA